MSTTAGTMADDDRAGGCSRLDETLQRLLIAMGEARKGVAVEGVGRFREPAREAGRCAFGCYGEGAQCCCGVRKGKTDLSAKETKGKVNALDLRRREANEAQVAVEIEPDPAVVLLHEGEDTRELGDVAPGGRAVHGEAFSDLALAQTLGMGREKHLEVKKAFCLADRPCHAAFPLLT